MRAALIRSCCLLMIYSLLVGCSGKSKGEKTPPPSQTPPTKTVEPAPPPTTAPAPTATGQPAASAPTTPQPSGQMTAAQHPALHTPPAPKLTLATSTEKSLGIPIYPGAKPETAAPLTNVGDFAQKLVLTTPDSMEQVELYYTKTFPGAVVMGRGKVGDQPFENLLLVSGKRAFFFQPSGKKEVRIELTVGK